MTVNRILVLFALLVPTSLVLIRLYINRETPVSILYAQQSQAKHFINEGKFTEGLLLNTQLSEKGMPFASFSVARIYAEGWGVSVDRQKAEEYLRIYVSQDEHLCNEVPKISAAFQLMARDVNASEERMFWRSKALEAGYQDSKCPPNYSFKD